MIELEVFTEKKFWIAAIINFAFIITLFIATTTYFSLLKNSLQNLETTELAKLKITEPEILLQHTKEIIDTSSTVNKIYAEWIVETLLYYASIVILSTLIYGNSLSIISKNKLMQKKETKNFAAKNAVFFAMIFIILTTIMFLGKTIFSAVFLTITLLIFCFTYLLFSASAKKQKAFADTIINAAKGIKFLVIRLTIGLACFIALSAVITSFASKINIIEVLMLVPLLAIIFLTWLEKKSTEAVS